MELIFSDLQDKIEYVIKFDILKRDVLKYFEDDKFVEHFLFAFMEYDTTILFEEHAHAYLTCGSQMIMIFVVSNLSIIQIIDKVLQNFHYLFSFMRDFEGGIVRTCKDHLSSCVSREFT